MERHSGRLLARIRLMLGDEARRRADSQDYLQSVMTRVFDALPRTRLESERDFLAWATCIARNDLRDVARRRREQAFDSLSASVCLQTSRQGPASRAAATEEREILLEALEDLEQDHRTVIELRDFEGLSFREIGARMCRSEAAAQMLHSRALTQLGKLAAALAERTSTAPPG